VQHNVIHRNGWFSSWCTGFSELPAFFSKFRVVQEFLSVLGLQQRFLGWQGMQQNPELSVVALGKAGEGFQEFAAEAFGTVAGQIRQCWGQG